MHKQGNIAVIHISKYLDGKDRLCHHNCLFCMERMEPGHSNRMLPPANIIEEALRKYADLNGSFDKIYIAGGEPTLRFDFNDIVFIVQKYCKNIILSTSCDFEDIDFTVKRIIKLGINNISTSVHSHIPFIHDWLTCCNNSYYKTIDAIKKFIDAGICVTVNSVINFFNICEIEKIVKHFKDINLKISKLTLTHYINHGNAYYHRELKFDINKYSNMLSAAISAVNSVNYIVTFRNFPICIDKRLLLYKEDVSNIKIIDLCSDKIDFISEKAPSITKKECHQCTLFSDCPKYLMANYGDE